MEYNCGFTEDNRWFRYRAAAIIVEDGCVLFAGNEKDDYYYSIGGAVHMGETAEDAVKREVFEETGVHYEIDHLAVIHENFFNDNKGALKNMDCHEIALYFVMKSRGAKELNSNSFTQGVRENMYWLPISELDKYKAFPTFMKEFLQSERMGVEHIVTDERNQKTSLYIPKLDELWFREELMSDPNTMSYNNAWGGTIPFPKEDWEDWYNNWVLDDDGKHFYGYLKNANGEFVGEVAYHIKGESNMCMADVIIEAKYREKGYGKDGLLLLCEKAKENGIDCIYDSIAIDNSAVKLFQDVGFVEEYRTEEFVLLKKQLQSRPVQIQQIENADEKQRISRMILEALPDWFGIPEAREQYIKESAEQPLFAAYDSDKPIGFLCLKETGKETVELCVMGVLKDYHRKGVGRKLFDRAREGAKQAGYSFMQVKTVRMGRYEDYDATNHFYLSLGFKEFEVFPTLWDEWNPCQIYVMAL